MANEELNTPAPVVEDAPVVETPVVAPVETVQVDPAPVENTPAPVVETPSESVVEAPKKDDPTLLGETKESDPAPVVETPPVEEAPKVEETVVETKEGGQSEEPAPPPSYEAFQVPEDVQLDSERITEFTKLLSDLEVTGRADHAAMQEFGQKALDFHVNEQKKLVETITKTQVETWEKTVLGWKDETIADPEYGGNRIQTTLDSANQFIRTYGGPAEQQKELREILNVSGIGNRLAVVRLFANAGKALSEGRPLAASTPVSAPKSRTATMYGPKE